MAPANSNSQSLNVLLGRKFTPQTLEMVENDQSVKQGATRRCISFESPTCSIHQKIDPFSEIFKKTQIISNNFQKFSRSFLKKKEKNKKKNSTEEKKWREKNLAQNKKMEL